MNISPAGKVRDEGVPGDGRRGQEEARGPDRPRRPLRHLGR